MTESEEHGTGLQRDDRIIVDGEELRVHAVKGDESTSTPYTEVVECYNGDGARRLLVVYPDEIRLTMGFVPMNRGEYEVVDPELVASDGQQVTLAEVSG